LSYNDIMTKPKRILIIGISGSGKSHLANALRDLTSLPVTHLDSIFWKENWVERGEEDVIRIIHNKLLEEIWIIEGYIEPLSSDRLHRADLVVYLDYSGIAAASGAIKRFAKHHKTPRAEMPAGNTDKFSWSFLSTVVQRKERAEIENAIKPYITKVTRIKSRTKLREYLNVLQQKIIV
jgi:adenylate kinase family enzyme